MSPDYAWWYGYADVLGHLASIRDEATRLRNAGAVHKRALFLIVTGPVMVLAVRAGSPWRGEGGVGSGRRGPTEGRHREAGRRRRPRVVFA